MQINRLLEIVYILLDKKTTTAKELAWHFEVSQRTIYRDVEALSGAGIPIYMSKGKGGGISLLPEFVLNKAVFTGEEKLEILASLKAVNSVDLSGKDSAVKKLSTLFGGKDADWIEVDFSSWANPEEEIAKFNTIKSAILNKKILFFNYSNAKGQQAKREVEPLKLCFKSGAWYLYAFCKMRKDGRFFKLTRIKELVTSQEIFSRKAPEKIFKDDDIFVDEFIRLKLKLSAEMAYRVYDEFNNFIQSEDGSFIAEIEYPKGEWIFYYINSFGESCEVLEPAEIRDEVIKKLKKTLNNYV